MSLQIIDLIAVISANVFNLIISAVMLSRLPGWKIFERVIGFINITLILPLSLVMIFNVNNGRDLWMVVLPGILIFFLIVELILDYILNSNFRQTKGVWLYLLVFYLAQWGMIGYAFQVDKSSGFTTLITYFLSLGTTAISYRKVGHGEG